MPDTFPITDAVLQVLAEAGEFSPSPRSLLRTRADAPLTREACQEAMEHLEACGVFRAHEDRTGARLLLSLDTLANPTWVLRCAERFDTHAEVIDTLVGIASGVYAPLQLTLTGAWLTPAVDRADVLASMSQKWALGDSTHPPAALPLEVVEFLTTLWRSVGFDVRKRVALDALPEALRQSACTLVGQLEELGVAKVEEGMVSLEKHLKRPLRALWTEPRLELQLFKASAMLVPEHLFTEFVMHLTVVGAAGGQYLLSDTGPLDADLPKDTVVFEPLTVAALQQRLEVLLPREEDDGRDAAEERKA